MNIILACDNKYGIGINNTLPSWKLKEDMQKFKKVTIKNGHNVVIMGKNTFLSIGKPLPNRENIVVSTTLKSADGCEIVRSLEEAINSSKENFPNKDIFLIGGYAIYKSGEIFADTLYLTEVDIEVEGDLSLPDFDWKSWKEMEREDFFDEGSGINCALIKYVKSS